MLTGFTNPTANPYIATLGPWLVAALAESRVFSERLKISIG